MIHTEEMLKDVEELINTPSVVGFYPEIHKKLQEIVEKWDIHWNLIIKEQPMYQVKLHWMLD